MTTDKDTEAHAKSAALSLKYRDGDTPGNPIVAEIWAEWEQKAKSLPETD